jgi:hypothetical protein
MPTQAIMIIIMPWDEMDAHMYYAVCHMSLLSVLLIYEQLKLPFHGP